MLTLSFLEEKCFDKSSLNIEAMLVFMPDRQCLATEAGVFGRWVDRITKHESHGGDNLVR